MVIGLVVGMPEPTVDMGMLIVPPPLPSGYDGYKSYKIELYRWMDK